MNEIGKNKNESIITSNKDMNESEYSLLIRKYESFVALGVFITMIFITILIYYIGREQKQDSCHKTNYISIVTKQTDEII